MNGLQAGTHCVGNHHDRRHCPAMQVARRAIGVYVRACVRRRLATMQNGYCIDGKTGIFGQQTLVRMCVCCAQHSDRVPARRVRARVTELKRVISRCEYDKSAIEMNAF